MAPTAHHDTKLLPKVLIAGTSACIADALTFPLDTAKVRLQVQGEGLVGTAVKRQYSGMINTIVTIGRQEGIRNLYNGLAAGLQRQMCFASVRIGMYDTTRDFYKRQFGVTGFGTGMDVTMRVLAGITTGGMAVLFAQPTDVVKVRMQAQKGGTQAKRYAGTLDAYKKIAIHEGRAGLWQGTVPNIARNAIVNVAEIVCYDIIKDTILHLKLLEDNIVCHFTSAFAAGFITTVVASPVDVVKTRYMNSDKGTYRGAIHCALSMGRSEGFGAFYKGFVPSFSRLVSWNILMWVTYEQMKILANKITHDINLNKSTPRIVTSSTGLGMEELF